MLRESGIKWRVLVVSACYSGTFAEPLADDSSIVITAAADNRKSFGCDDKRQLTYFGEAFYRDAFDRLPCCRRLSRRRVTEGEERPGITPSLPQAHFGAQIQARDSKKRTSAGTSIRCASLSPQ